jgi:iron complex transport system ATP-binding protein
MNTQEKNIRLEASNVSLGYKQAPISKHLSVHIPDKSFTVIVGPNGCGKSTLLKGLSRLITPSEGHVFLDEKPIQHYPSKSVAKILGLLPQTATAPSGIRVKELIARGRYPHQTTFRQWSTEDRYAIDEAIKSTHLESIVDQPVNELSGGQRQRVWIAMVLAQQTPYLLLDEPTTFLDIAHQLELMDLCYDLYKKQGRTIVAVLHDINQACRYADHMIAMKAGKVIQYGAPEKVITEANMKDIFGLDCVIIKDPVSNTPLIIPKDNRKLC